MAKGRILRRHVGESVKVDQLWQEAGAEAALLYTWCIPWLDINGNLRGDPLWVLATIVPRAANRDAVELKDVRRYLEAMCELGLFLPYEVEGRKYLHSPGFEDEQLYLRPDREDAECPPFPDRPKGHAGQGDTARGQEAPRRTPAKRGQEAPRGDVTVDPDAEIPLQELLEGLGSELEQEWWEGHPSKRQVLGWWLEALSIGRHPRPPDPSIHRQGKVAERLGERHTRQDLARAMVGMARLFPWADPSVEPKSPHRSWDLMNLEKQFTAAHAATVAWEGGDGLDEEF